MKRRDVILGLGAGTALTACGQPGSAPAVQTSRSKTFEWKMVTTWPKNFPGLGTAAEYLAESITQASGGRLKVRVYGAGERVPALEVFDAVSRGAAEMGHGAAYYWKGKAPAAPFFTAIPFGLTSWEMNGWLYFGGGLELWRELYAPFNLMPFEAGNTGTQMGGWFRQPVNSLADLQGLKMRIPGLGGEVMKEIGVTTVNIPGNELFTSLQTGAIDATEWVSAYNDLAFGLYKAAKYYYYPGWHEPGPTLEAIVNMDRWRELPEDLQAVVRTCCQAAGSRMMAEYAARNQRALKTLTDEHGVQVKAFPDEVINALAAATGRVLARITGEDEMAAKIYDSYRGYREQVSQSTAILEHAYLNARATADNKGT
ncbi:MAG: ABC transporter substrate-binding protein [Salinisphaeraceae bacterium]|jgi:TRAP-type mannitol/chloroaromatic compound transport system substrate-binding protein|nr:ABC transporter substrate-binding protein [Salinisphaeraceae bacterium]